MRLLHEGPQLLPPLVSANGSPRNAERMVLPENTTCLLTSLKAPLNLGRPEMRRS
ncbi:Hypothetical protein A7982_08382 [Minicystis rosea]|nr:Hypothetical protein A7982_08382 [Minicystis rosea]